MLIRPSYKQVEIAFAGHDRLDPSAALPIAVGNTKSMKFGHSCMQYRQRPNLRACWSDDVRAIQILHGSHWCLACSSHLRFASGLKPAQLLAAALAGS